jgi:hypothetical protein
MTLNIELTPQSEAWVAAQAKMRGVQPADIVKRLIEEQVVYGADHPKGANEEKTPIDAENAAAIALLSRWIAEDATEDQEEIRKADEEVAELRRNLNANRAAAGERLASR